MKKSALAAAVLLLALVAYLLLWPTPIDPVVWAPPPAPPLTGDYAVNDKLKDVQRLGVGAGMGPEGIAVDAAGRIYAGYNDGRIVTFSANGGSFQELAISKGGHPLGITFGPNGGLLVADAHKGLLAVGASRTPKSLVTAVDGAPVVFADDVDNSRYDKKVYFTDASKYPFDSLMNEFLEHRGTGRLIEYDVGTGASKVLLGGLHFANGVAVGPNDEYLLVNETGAYRVLRYWLKGEKTGTHEVFIDNLPGLPDNISWAESGHFWLALFSPRSKTLDDLAGKPAWVKKLVSRLPRFLQPTPPTKSWVLGLDTNGKVIANLQYEGKDAYGPITSVEEWGPWLYFGSLTANSIARLPLNTIIPGAPPPPPGWEKAPAKPHQFRPPVVEEEQERDTSSAPTAESDDRKK